MLNKLKQWWNDGEEAVQGAPDLSLTVTKLLTGMMIIDGKVDDNEYSEIVDILQARFGMSAEECETLVEQAIADDAPVQHFEQMVEQLTVAYNIEQRTEILRALWRVANADGEVDFVEDQYINRLSSLIGVSTEALMDAKKQ